MKHILCFGDSNTYGLIPGTMDRYGWGTRWTSIVDERIKERGYRVIEEGLCGRTTKFDDLRRKGRRGTELLPVLLEAHSPIDLVIVMLGTNDCKTSYHASSEDIGRGAEQLIDQVKGYDPNIEILLISPISLGEGVWEKGYDTEFSPNSVMVSKELPEVYRSIARRKNIDFLAASDYVKPSKEDREHLDAKGHRIFAGVVTQKVQSMLQRRFNQDQAQRICRYEEVAS